MIAKSDVFIIALSSALLVAGIVRWQSNLGNVNQHAEISGQASVANSVVKNAHPATTNPSLVNQSVNNSVNAAVSNSNVSTRSSTALSSSTASVLGNVNSAGNTKNLNQQIVAPASSTQNTKNTISDANDSGLLYGTHRVVSGDFLARIAQTYGTTVETLQKINGISGTLIYVDQEIKYPLPAN